MITSEHKYVHWMSYIDTKKHTHTYVHTHMCTYIWAMLLFVYKENVACVFYCCMEGIGYLVE